ncbi:MAG: phosphotransferase [Anaerolineae bacterium]
MTGEEIAGLLTHYDLGELLSCNRVEHGYVNENWFIDTTTGRYFLKRRHPSLRDPHRLSAQHVLVQHLNAAGFPAPAIIPARDGSTFLDLEDETYEIHSYIPGTIGDIGQPAHFAAAARTLGWYHATVEGFNHRRLHPRRRYTPSILAQIVERLVDDWRGQTSPALDGLLRKLQAHVVDLASHSQRDRQLSELVIHGDYYTENLIFQGDVVAGVVDYDLARWTWRVVELAETLIYFAAERPGRLKHVVYPGVLDLSAAQRFLAAYSDAVSLSNAETLMSIFVGTCE